MQMEAADAFDVSREPQHIRDAYGAGVQARQLLIARRLIERGVRFVQSGMATASPGTTMTISKSITASWPGNAIRPIAALLRI